MKKSKIQQLQNHYSQIERTNISILCLIVPVGFILYAGNDYLFTPIQSVSLYYYEKYTVITGIFSFSGVALLVCSFFKVVSSFTYENIVIHNKNKYRLMKDKLKIKSKKQAQAKQFLIAGIIALLLFAFSSFHLEGLTKREINRLNSNGVSKVIK